MPIVPISEYKILQGSAGEVETALNELRKDYAVMVQGMNTIFAQDQLLTTVVVELYPNPN